MPQYPYLSDILDEQTAHVAQVAGAVSKASGVPS